MPYPACGIEFSDGLKGHLGVRLWIGGGDMWIKDNVDLYIRQIRQVATAFDTAAWEEDVPWTSIGTWSQDVALGTDPSEGVPTRNLIRS